ncbi:hypothetical protein BB560_005659, partial [Smittium megazygosporum]
NSNMHISKFLTFLSIASLASSLPLNVTVGCDPEAFIQIKKNSVANTRVVSNMYNYQASSFNSNSNSQVCQPFSIDFGSATDFSMFDVEYCPNNARLSNGLLQLDLTKECGTTLIYNQPIRRGRVDVVMKPAPSSGSVTALVFSGPPPSDEIDIEFVGRDPTQVQSMYFVKGSRIELQSQFHSSFPVSDMTKVFNTYSFELTDKAVNWFLNGDLVRTLPNKGSLTFPGDITNFRFGVWDGSNTSGWAGTIDWSIGSRSAFIKSISIKPYC